MSDWTTSLYVTSESLTFYPARCGACSSLYSEASSFRCRHERLVTSRQRQVDLTMLCQYNIIYGLIKKPIKLIANAFFLYLSWVKLFAVKFTILFVKKSNIYTGLKTYMFFFCTFKGRKIKGTAYEFLRKVILKNLLCFILVWLYWAGSILAEHWDTRF